jgi:uncharacterized protein (DUF1800 family)
MREATHLLNRIAFGPRPRDADRVQKIGIEKYIEEQLYPERIDDGAVEARLDEIPSLKMSVAELLDKYPPMQGLHQNVLQQLQAQKIIRAVHSERRLQEVMTDFWFNHFNVFWGKNANRWLTTGFEMNAIRPNALGKFKDLLMATARHPAMLFYLDNHLSSARTGINENYARELMELHTLGVDGGYTQKDVQEVARAFTGWSIDGPRRRGEFRFRPRMHDRGEKVVLGNRVAAGGINQGEIVIDILSKHPSTARFIAAKLARRFVSDNPPQSLVGRTADIYLKTGGAQTKMPFEFAISSIRALDGFTDGSRQVAQTIGRMGQPLYLCQPPTGFPDSGDHWIGAGAVLERLNFAMALSANRIAGTTVQSNGSARAAALMLGSPDFQKR